MSGQIRMGDQRRSPRRANGRTRTGWIVAGLGAVLSLLVVSCGSAQPGSPQGGDAGTLTIGFNVPPESMDPAKMSTDSSLYANLAYDPLIYQAPDGSLQPRLAESWNYVGAGNKTFELKLRPNVRFSDGSPLSADVVKANFDRELQMPIGKILLGPVKSIDTVDPLTVRLTLAQANPELPLLFSQNYVVGNMTSGPSVGQPNELATKTVGAGPYVLDPTQTVPKDHYTFTANPDYWNKPAVRYSKVVVKVIPNSNTALSAVQTGQVDAIRGDFTTVNAAKSAGLQITWTPFSFIGLAITDRAGKLVPALGDVRVRQALNFAIDRAGITKALFGEYGKPTEQVVLPGQDGFNPTDFYQYDPAKAKQLLAAAGYPNGFTLPVLTRTTFGTDRVVQAVADNLKQVGVQVQLTSEPNLTTYTQEAQSGKWPAVGILYGASPVYLEAQGLFGPQAATFNPMKTTDPQLTALYNNAAAADPSARSTLDQQVVRWITEQGWFAPVVFTPNLYYARSGVAGVQVSPGNPKANPVDWRPAGKP